MKKKKRRRTDKKLTILTCIWKRPEIFELFCLGVKLCRRVAEVQVVVVGSEGRRSRKLAKKYGFTYVECSNSPLGRKWNTGALECAKHDSDYFLMMGSDDLFGVKLMEEYGKYMDEGIDYVYLTDCYFYDIESKKALYWGGYRGQYRGYAAGIGRLLSRRLMEQLNWLPWYDEKYSDLLDTAMDLQLQKITHTAQAISLKEEKLFAVDVKSPVNMTPFELWDNCKFVHAKDMLFYNLPTHVANEIYESN